VNWWAHAGRTGAHHPTLHHHPHHLHHHPPPPPHLAAHLAGRHRGAWACHYTRTSARLAPCAMGLGTATASPLACTCQHSLSVYLHHCWIFTGIHARAPAGALPPSSLPAYILPATPPAESLARSRLSSAGLAFCVERFRACALRTLLHARARCAQQHGASSPVMPRCARRRHHVATLGKDRQGLPPLRATACCCAQLGTRSRSRLNALAAALFSAPYAARSRASTPAAQHRRALFLLAKKTRVAYPKARQNQHNQ